MARTSSAKRAARLLALLGMLEPGTHIALGDLAQRMGVSAEEIVADLELLSMCGVAPYDPGDLVPIYVDQGAVHVWGALPALDRTVRLSAPEAHALAAALQVAGRSSADPLVERLLTAASEIDPAEPERLVRAAVTGGSAVWSTLAAAGAARECVRISYLATGATTETERLIEPMALFAERGAWYATAYCRHAEGVRTFRLDRVREAATTGERFDPRDPAAGVASSAIPRGVLPLARIRFEPGTTVPEREWPGLRVLAEDAQGTLVEVPFAGTEWIAREVASFLGRAVVVEPAEVRQAVGSLAAAALGA